MATCLALAGCSGPGNSSAAKGTGTEYATLENLQPEVIPGKLATLKVAGTDVPVTIVGKQAGGVLHLDLVAHGSQFEFETYSYDKVGFRVTDAAGESYLPPIDLVRFPFHVGDGYRWKGSIENGGRKRNATATVSSTEDKMFVGEVPVGAIRTDVDLTLDGDPNLPPVKRRLSFWIVPSKGIQKREFGSVSVRVPQEP